MRKFDPSFRTRCWSLVLYEDPLKVFSSLLSECSHYAFAFHEHDLRSDGSLKEPHYHLIVCLSNAKTFSALKIYYSGEENLFGEPVRIRNKAFRYLRHLDDPDKYQYPLDVVVSDDIKYWENLDPNSVSSSDGEKTLSMLDDILAHLPYRELVSRYGRDLVKNFATYRAFAIQMLADERARSSCPADTLVPSELSLLDLTTLRRSSDDPF